MAIGINFNPTMEVIEGRYDGKFYTFPYGEKVKFPDDAKSDFLSPDPEGPGLAKYGLVELSYSDKLETEGAEAYLKEKEKEALRTLLNFLETVALEREEQFIREVQFKQIRDENFTTARKKKILDDIKKVKARLKALEA